jgi:hypothetical protein
MVLKDNVMKSLNQGGKIKWWMEVFLAFVFLAGLIKLASAQVSVTNPAGGVTGKDKAQPYNQTPVFVSNWVPVATPTATPTGTLTPSVTPTPTNATATPTFTPSFTSTPLNVNCLNCTPGTGGGGGAPTVFPTFYIVVNASPTPQLNVAVPGGVNVNNQFTPVPQFTALPYPTVGPVTLGAGSNAIGGVTVLCQPNQPLFGPCDTIANNFVMFTINAVSTPTPIATAIAGQKYDCDVTYTNTGTAYGVGEVINGAVSVAYPLLPNQSQEQIIYGSAANVAVDICGSASANVTFLVEERLRTHP